MQNGLFPDNPVRVKKNFIDIYYSNLFYTFGGLQINPKRNHVHNSCF